MRQFPIHHPDDPEEVAFHRLFGPWAVVEPAGVREMLGDFAAPWWVAGGRAIDAFTRTPRVHDDIDVSLFRKDVAELHRALDGRLDIWSAGPDGIRPLWSRNPDVHPNADQVWLRESSRHPWLADVLLNPDRDGDWVSERDESYVRPLDEVTWTSDDEIRYLLPQIVLIFKAKLARPKDRLDLERTWPLLDEAARAELRDYVLDRHPDHAWLDVLTG